MATSGTVATTTINTSTLIEHAVRRCKLPAAAQTPELVQAAKESLYTLLLSLANRGLHLWAVEKQLIGAVVGKATYTTDPGTLEVLNVIYSAVTRVTGTDSSTASSFTTQLSSAVKVLRIGVKFSAVTASSTLTLAGSTDGISYTTLTSQARTDWTTGRWYWFDVPIVGDYVYYKASSTAALTFTEFYLANGITDQAMSPWNRDTYLALPNKNTQGHPCTNYLLEKKLTPQLTVWPVPDTAYDQLTLMVHRQIQDIGTLVQQVEIPQRWLEAIIWQLAMRVGFEHPQMDDTRLQLLIQKAGEFQIEADSGESDGMPIYITPNIGVYTA